MQGTIQTYTGLNFSLLDPDPASITIEDIAHALSHQCRFTGHCKYHYSVAQHSVLVSYFCHPDDAKHGLLHDAAEGYCSDLATPLKYLPEMSKYVEIEHNIQARIYERFGLDPIAGPTVKPADIRLVRAEAFLLLSDPKPSWACADPEIEIISLQPHQAKAMFLNRYHSLFS